MNSEGMVIRITTAIIVLIVVIAGGVVMLTNPGTLSFKEYVTVVATAVGLLSIGYGLDSHSRP